MKIDQAIDILLDVRSYMASLYTLDNTYSMAGHSYADIANAIGEIAYNSVGERRKEKVIVDDDGIIHRVLE